ncbi:MAG: hypothetical protein KC912_09335 [Proteobacteria bacterium]|nr:hypothetical protein [Pseudomonadota bacterium]
MPKLTDLLGRPHSGIVPTAVIGIVKDNDDPDELGRVQVTFPTLVVSGGSDNAVSFWLRVLSPDAGSASGSLDGKGQQAVGAGNTKGSGRGFYAVPEIDDEVLVLFTQGSQDVGVVIGQLYNGADGPPDEAIGAMPAQEKLWDGGVKSTAGHSGGSTDDRRNDRRIWKSRSGAMLVFDDTTDNESVQIWNNKQTLALVFDSATDCIILSNSVGDIHIRTATDLYLEAGNDIFWEAGRNLEGHAATDIIEEAGANYEFKAGSSGKMEFGTSFDAKAGTAATVEAGTDLLAKGGVGATLKGGATAEVNGAAQTTIKGGMVMIN